MSEANPWVEDVSEGLFERRVLERSHEVPVVVDFWAEWCGPCRILGPTLEKLASELAGRFVLAKVDVDRAPRLAQLFGIRGIPAVMAFRRGEAVAQFTGALPEDAVRAFLAKVCPSEAEELFERAENLRARDTSAAEGLYKKALELDDGHEGARVGLAELLVERNALDEAAKLMEGLEPLGPLSPRIEHLQSEMSLHDLAPAFSETDLRKKLQADPDDGRSLVELGKLLASQRRYPEALDALLHAAGVDRELAEGEAKELMVDIFNVVGVRSELADEYRTKLSRLLH
ncbi:MAG TPA: tetratricopeptide repeat protein [Vicinamibacteria bacterium]|nr:tetratricopeptide repeat protein [Vicinamibacteria bacterium]